MVLHTMGNGQNLLDVQDKKSLQLLLLYLTTEKISKKFWSKQLNVFVKPVATYNSFWPPVAFEGHYSKSLPLGCEAGI